MKREALVPIDDELRAMISAQHDRVRLQWPDGTPVLFPRPQTNLAGTLPVGGSTYRGALYCWLADCDIRDEHGQPVHLTPHQWRHTLGTVLINRDVPQHVVQKILDHDSPLMTVHYARLSDKTVREHWERARKVNASGQPVQLSPDGPLGDAAWAKQQLSRATQALPNGYCQLPRPWWLIGDTPCDVLDRRGDAGHDLGAAGVFPLGPAAELACHVDEACPFAGAGPAGRGAGAVNVLRVAEEGAAAGGGDPGPSGRVAA
jgi:hypothetical protein